MQAPQEDVNESKMRDLLDLDSKTVEDYLNDVIYTEHNMYCPSDFALEFVTFIKLVNGDQGEENKTPVVHYKMLDTITTGSKRITNLCHRGIAKTTVMGEYLFLYLAVYGSLPGFGEIDLALYVSDSIENGVKNMRKNLEHRWETSDFLRMYVPKIKFTDIRWEFNNIDGRKFIVKGYGAKALSLDSELHTISGTTTIKDCKVGDQIYGIDGKLATITKKSEIFHHDMFKIVLEDGRELKVSDSHLNPVVLKQNVNNKARYEDVVLPTYELIKEPLLHSRNRSRRNGTDYVSNENLMFVRNIAPIEYPEKDLPIDPYTLGVILGDGRIRKECGSVELTAHRDEFSHYYKEIPYTFGSYRDDPRSNAATQSIRGLGPKTKALGINVRGELKFIPDEYWTASIPQRLAVVQGLMDTDGTCTSTGRTTFCSSSQQLCDDLLCLVRSLGGSGKMYEMKGVNAFRVEIWMELNCFRLKRKAEKFKPRSKLMAVKSINTIKMEPSQCIAVNNESRQFIANCYFPTHNTGVRGAKEMGKRPQLAVLDDLFSDEDAKSPTIIENVEATIYKAVTYALHPKNNLIIWSGTPFNASDPLYKAVESGAWAVNVFPVCETFPCSREDFRSSWPDRFTYDYVSEQYQTAVKTGKADTFNQELMLRIMSEEDRLIQECDISWYNRKTLLASKEQYNFYITTDFATGAERHNDFSVISVWAYNSNGDWFWVDGVVKKQEMDQNVHDLFKFAQMYKPQQVGIEVSGQQGGFIPWIREEMMRRNVWFALASENNNGKPGIRPVSNKKKIDRFEVVVPWFKMNKIFFPQERKESPELIQAMDELRLVSKKGFKSKHDDFSDTISMLSLLQAWKPSDTPLMSSQGGLWDSDDDDDEPNVGISSYVV